MVNEPATGDSSVTGAGMMLCMGSAGLAGVTAGAGVGRPQDVSTSTAPMSAVPRHAAFNDAFGTGRVCNPVSSVFPRPEFFTDSVDEHLDPAAARAAVKVEALLVDEQLADLSEESP